MIVEDSLTVRRMLTQAIAQQTGLEIDAFDTLKGSRLPWGRLCGRPGGFTPAGPPAERLSTC
ncbi:hypothetical protein DA11_07765 [Aeromonas caviae]|nr:hypothetical protein DA11_07765 [Aeromonas caviae]